MQAVWKTHFRQSNPFYVGRILWIPYSQSNSSRTNSVRARAVQRSSTEMWTNHQISTSEESNHVKNISDVLSKFLFHDRPISHKTTSMNVAELFLKQQFRIVLGLLRATASNNTRIKYNKDNGHITKIQISQTRLTPTKTVNYSAAQSIRLWTMMKF
jgi:hypothetical protein